LLAVYRDAAPAFHSRLLHEILAWDDARIEAVHD
jgi:hypothetical protein